MEFGVELNFTINSLNSRNINPKRDPAMKSYMAVLFLIPAISMASTPVEEDAIISSNVSKLLVQELAKLVKSRGHPCPSVSIATTFLTSRGFNFSCGKSRYRYEVRQKGDAWTVTVQ